jgi:hypothetical protein
LRLNGGEANEITGAFGTNDLISVSVRVDDVLISSGLRVCKIDKTAGGKEFTGFPSKRFYLTARFNGVSGAAGIMLTNLCGFTAFQNINKDISKPIIILDSDISMIRGLNEIVTVPSAWAIDILDFDVSLSVSVRYGLTYIINNETADNPRFFMTDQFGFYNIIYRATDSSGNTTLLQYNVYVVNVIPPVLKLSEPAPTEAVVDKVLPLPLCTAQDALSGEELEVRIFVKDYNGSFTDLSEIKAFTPPSAGVYTIYYYARDKEFVYDIIEFTINVK